MKSPTFTCKIDLSLKQKLKQDLQEQGFSFSKPPYTVFSAQNNGVTCILYESGSLVVQGKGKDEFIEFYLEPEILKSLAYTYPEVDTDMTPRIGVDEAGKGDFFGPLCIAAVYADGELIKQLLALGVKDSKRLSDSSIKTMAKSLKTLPHTTVRLFPEKYNELYGKFKNLNLLLGWGHATAIEDLQKKTKCTHALIDQFAAKEVVASALKRKQVVIDLEQRHKGEQDVVVAAASILARDSFLEGLEKLSGDISFILPKGAAAIVKDAARKIVTKQGVETLQKVAKTHFKTYQEVLDSLPSSD